MVLAQQQAVGPTSPQNASIATLRHLVTSQESAMQQQAMHTLVVYRLLAV
jgi:hypothetical protein